MSRFAGPVGWRFSGDKTRGFQLRGPARLLVQQTLDMLKGKPGNASQHKVLPDGSTIRVQVIVAGPGQAPITHVYIIAPGGKREVEIPVTIIDYDCGAVSRKVILEFGEGKDVFAGVETHQTPQGWLRIPQPQSVARQAVPLRNEFMTMADQAGMERGLRYSQHRRMRPGNYTGYMRQLVQLLLGIGIAQENTYEGRLVTDKLIPPLAVKAADHRKLKDTWGIYKNPPPEVAWVRYDYRWYRTHGLAWNAQGKCFVVQIGQQGVFAWPLAIDPDSIRPEFRVQYELIYPELFQADLSGVGLFDLFGGFPGWEQPPMNLDAWVRAGEGFELLSREAMNDFYSKMPMYTNCGWAFAPRDGFAVNTCYNWDGNVKRGFLYAVRFAIGEWVEPEPVAQSAQLAGMLPSLAPYLYRKIKRLSEDQVEGLINTARDDAEKAVELLKDLTVMSPGRGEAALSKMQDGLLYHPALREARGDRCFMPTTHPQIKFPEEMFNYQVSFDFSADNRSGEVPKLADGPVWACFVGDQLMVVNYFWEKKEPERLEPIDTREECQETGTWEYRRESTTFNRGHFYSNFFDLRRTLVSTPFSSKTTGKKVGGMDYYFTVQTIGNCGFMYHYNYYVYDTTHKQAESTRWWSGLAVPFGDRSIIYSATMAQEIGLREWRSVSQPTTPGRCGVTKWGYIYEWVCHWTGGCPSGKTKTGDDPCVLSPMLPDDVNPNNCCQDPPGFFEYKVCDDPNCRAWIGNRGKCPPYPCIFSAFYNDTVPRTTGYSTSDKAVNSFAWEIKVWGDTHIHGKSILKGADSGEDMERFDTPMSEWWWLSSPVCPPPYFCRFEVSVNSWGRSLINYDNQVDPMRVLHDGAPESMYIGSGATFFGYVSDEVISHG